MRKWIIIALLVLLPTAYFLARQSVDAFIERQIKSRIAAHEGKVRELETKLADAESGLEQAKLDLQGAEAQAEQQKRKAEALDTERKILLTRLRSMEQERTRIQQEVARVPDTEIVPRIRVSLGRLGLAPLRRESTDCPIN